MSPSYCSHFLSFYNTELLIKCTASQDTFMLFNVNLQCHMVNLISPAIQFSIVIRVDTFLDWSVVVFFMAMSVRMFFLINLFIFI